LLAGWPHCARSTVAPSSGVEYQSVSLPASEPDAFFWAMPPAALIASTASGKIQLRLRSAIEKSFSRQIKGECKEENHSFRPALVGGRGSGSAGNFDSANCPNRKLQAIVSLLR